MADTLDLLLVLSAQDQASDVLRGLAGTLDHLGVSFQALTGAAGLAGEVLNGIGGAAQRVGTGLALSGALLAGVGIAAGEVMQGLTDDARQFETVTTNVQNNTNMSIADTNRMREAILQLAQETGASWEQLAEGYMHVMNVTQNAAVATDILRVATESAVSTGGNAGVVANILANAMHEYGLDVSTAATETERHNEVVANATRVMGQLHLAAAESNAELPQFAEFTARAIAVGANFHVPFDQVLASLTALSKHGFPDMSQAAIQVQDVMLRMAQPTKQAEKALTELTRATGVDLVHDFTAAGLQAKGLQGVLEDLHEAFGRLGLSEADSAAMAEKLINAQRGGIGLAVLLGTAWEDEHKTLADLNNQQLVNTVTEESMARTKETLTNQQARLTQMLEATRIEVGEALVPALRDLFDRIIPLVSQVAEWIKANPTLTATILEVAAAGGTLLGALMLLGGALLMLNAVFSPITLVLAGIGATIAALALAWNENFLGIRDVASRVGADLTAVFEIIGEGLSGLQEIFSATLGGILDTVTSIGKQIADALSFLNPFAEHSPSLVTQVSQGVAEILHQYEQMGRIGLPLSDAGQAIQDFTGMSADQLRQLAETSKRSFEQMKGNLQDVVDATRSQFDELKAALQAAKDDLRRFSEAPLKGTKEFEDQLFALEMQTAKVQLQLDQMKLSGASKESMKPLEEELQRLSLRADTVRLTEKLQLDPLRKQIRDAASDTKELSFQEIMEGIKRSKDAIAILAPAVATMGATLAGQQEGLKATGHALAGIGDSAGGASKSMTDLLNQLKNLRSELAKPPPAPPTDLTALIGQRGAERGRTAQEEQKEIAETTSAWRSQVESEKQSILAAFDRITGALHQAADAVRTTLGPAFEHLKELAEPALASVVATVQEKVSQVSDWWEEHHGEIEETARRVWEAVATEVHAVLGELIPFVQGEVSQVSSWWQQHHGEIEEAARRVWEAIQTVVSTVLGEVVPFVQGEVSQVSDWWEQHHEKIELAARRVWGAIQTVVSTVLGWIVEHIAGRLGEATEGVRNAWDLIQLIIAGALEVLKVIVRVAWEIIKEDIDTVLKDLESIILIAVDIINGDWQDAWDEFLAILKRTWNTAVDNVRLGVNGIIDLLDDLIRAFNRIHFQIPGFTVPLPGGGSVAWSGIDVSVIQIPEIPEIPAGVLHLQTGGVVTGPTLALLGEAGPEAVVPLSSVGGGQAPTTVVFDFRGSQVMSDRDIDLLIDKIDRRLPSRLAAAGIQVRR